MTTEPEAKCEVQRVVIEVDLDDEVLEALDYEYDAPQGLQVVRADIAIVLKSRLIADLGGILWKYRVEKLRQRGRAHNPLLGPTTAHEINEWQNQYLGRWFAPRRSPCSECGAGVGEPCRTPGGREREAYHDERWR